MEINHFIMIPAFYLAIPFLFLLLFVNWMGYRFKNLHLKKFKGVEHVGIGPTEGSLLGLTALLLSFTFGMSATKFEGRRQLIVTEINDMATTILRCDLYPDSVRDLFREDLKNYLETRIKYYGTDNDTQRDIFLSASDSISKICWDRAAELSHNPDNRVASELMVPALNAMMDIVTTREASRKAAVPPLILIILCVLIIVSAFLSGYGSKVNERNPVLVMAFAFMTSLALYLVVDLDRPQRGVINLNKTEQQMKDLRSSFNKNG